MHLIGNYQFLPIKNSNNLFYSLQTENPSKFVRNKKIYR